MPAPIAMMADSIGSAAGSFRSFSSLSHYTTPLPHFLESNRILKELHILITDPHPDALDRPNRSGDAFSKTTQAHL